MPGICRTDVTCSCTAGVWPAVPVGFSVPVPLVPVGDGALVGGVPAGGVPAGGVPAGGVPGGGVIVGGVPAGGVDVGGVPAGGVAVGGVPAGGVAVGGVPAGGVAVGGVDGVTPVAPGWLDTALGWSVPSISTRELAYARKSLGLPPVSVYDVVAGATLDADVPPFGVTPVSMNPPGCPGCPAVDEP